jgi:hypothetical protein
LTPIKLLADIYWSAVVDRRSARKELFQREGEALKIIFIQKIFGGERLELSLQARQMARIVEKNSCNLGKLLF